MTTKWKSKQTKRHRAQSSSKLIIYDIQIEYLILNSTFYMRNLFNVLIYDIPATGYPLF